jgi:hypothetical protein
MRSTSAMIRQTWLLGILLCTGIGAGSISSQAGAPGPLPQAGIFSFERDLPGTEDSITLYVVTPPARISWDSPKHLARSTVWSSIRSSYHSIGHVTVQTSCRLTTGEKINFWTGMTASDDNTPDKLLLTRDKIGLGISCSIPSKEESSARRSSFETLRRALRESTGSSLSASS